MRGLSFIVLALIAMLLVGGVVLVIHPPSWLPQASAILSGVSSHASSDQGADRKAPAPEPPPAPKRHMRTKDLPPSKAEEASIPAPPMQPRSLYHFPLASEIATGSTRADILSTYGPPEATITGADLGRLQERLIYVEKPTRRKTSISILNGKVVAAQTYTE